MLAQPSRMPTSTSQSSASENPNSPDALVPAWTACPVPELPAALHHSIVTAKRESCRQRVVASIWQEPSGVAASTSIVRVAEALPDPSLTVSVTS